MEQGAWSEVIALGMSGDTYETIGARTWVLMSADTYGGGPGTLIRKEKSLDQGQVFYSCLHVPGPRSKPLCQPVQVPKFKVEAYECQV